MSCTNPCPGCVSLVTSSYWLISFWNPIFPFTVIIIAVGDKTANSNIACCFRRKPRDRMISAFITCNCMAPVTYALHIHIILQYLFTMTDGSPQNLIRGKRNSQLFRFSHSTSLPNLRSATSPGLASSVNKFCKPS